MITTDKIRLPYIGEVLDSCSAGEVITKDNHFYIKILEDGEYDLKKLFCIKKLENLIVSIGFNASVKLITNGVENLLQPAIITNKLPENSLIKYEELAHGKKNPLLLGAVICEDELIDNISFPTVYNKSYIPKKITNFWSNENFLVINNNSKNTLILINENSILSSPKGMVTDWHPMAELIATKYKCNVIGVRYHYNYIDYKLGFSGHFPTTSNSDEDVSMIQNLLKNKLPKTKNLVCAGYCFGQTTALTLGFKLGITNIHIWDGFHHNIWKDKRAKWLFTPDEQIDLNFSIGKYLNKKENTKIYFYYTTLYKDFELDESCPFVNNIIFNIIDNKILHDWNSTVRKRYSTFEHMVSKKIINFF